MICPSSGKTHLASGMFWAALLGAALLLGWLIPVKVWASLPDLCWFHRLSGRPCPSCGLTRSWAALLHGDFEAAFHFHALGPLLLVGLVGYLFLWRQQVGFRKGLRWAGWAMAGLWVTYGLVRMFQA